MVRFKNILTILLLTACLAGVDSPAQAGKTTQVRLPNGLDVILVENHRAPVVSLMVWVNAGSTVESEREYGMAHLIEHMVFKGTTKRGPGDIAREVEAAGGTINAYTSYDETVFYISMAGRYADRGLDILNDLVYHATMPVDEFSREKEVVIEEIKMGLDSPQKVIGKAIFGEAYQVSPYGRPVIGFESSVRNISREDVLNYYHRWYVPENCILVVAGDFDTETFKGRIEEVFGPIPQGAAPEYLVPEEPAQTELRTRIIRRDVGTARMLMAFHIPPYKSKDVPALDLLSEVLGGGRASRLYRKIKRDEELVNSIYTWSHTPKGPGLFFIGGDLSAGNMEPALESILREVTEIGRMEVSSEELDRAKLSVQAGFIRSRESMGGEARLAATFQALTGDYRSKDTYLSEVEKVSLDEIRQVAARYLRPENMSLVVMVPEKPAHPVDDAGLAAAVQKGVETAVARKNVPESDNIQKYILKNGITLLVKQDRSLPLIDLRAAFLGGIRYETEATNGLNNLMAEVWDRGAAGMTALELARATEDMAAEISSFSGRNSFGLEAEFLSRYRDRGLELFAKVLTQPTFSPEEVEKAKPNILADIKRRRDQMTARAFELFAQAVYDGHPYRFTTSGTPESISKLTSDDLHSFYNTYAKPRDLVIAVVGDVQPDMIKERLEEYLSGWTGKVEKSPRVHPVTPWQGLKKKTENLDRAQSHLVLGFPAPPMDHPDRYALDVLDKILSGMGGRMFIELRDKQSLGYSVSSFYSAGLDAGAFGLYIGFDPAKADKVRAGFFDIIKDLHQKSISSKELQAAKEYLLGQYEIAQQTYSAQAAEICFNQLYGLGLDYEKKYVQGITEVTAEDVKRVAKKYLKLSQAAEVTIGPAS